VPLYNNMVSNMVRYVRLITLNRAVRQAVCCQFVAACCLASAGAQEPDARGSPSRHGAYLEDVFLPESENSAARPGFSFESVGYEEGDNDCRDAGVPNEGQLASGTLVSEAASGEPCTCACCQKKEAAKKQPTRKCVTCCRGRRVDWATIPPAARPMPRPGNFWVFPAEPGFYSLWDVWTCQWRDKPPPSGYPPFALMPPSFFDSNWSFVEGLDPAKRNLVESLKRVHLSDCLMFATGGQAWSRYMHETNSRLLEANNDYLLARTRVWGDLWYADTARLYGEYLWADSFAEDLAPLPIDVNRGDLLNLFVDVKLGDWEDKPVYVRFGRQELLLGSQRLVSTLDWANTRRTFEGVRVFRQGEKWDVDLFWTQLVPPLPSDFDRADHKRDFAGAWLTYRPKPGHFIDLYYLYANHNRPVNEQGLAVAPFDANTFGTRYAGDRNNWLWDFETAVQFGRRGGQDLLAGASTAGVGRRFAEAPARPTAWIYYDWASGDASPGVGGRSSTFNQLYPFGHYYLGWIDLVGRQNIHDVNGHLLLFPANWVTLWLQYHHFWLHHRRDALYNAGGVAIRRDPTGAAGNNVGDEIDVVLNIRLARYTDMLTGYSRLFGGSFLERTANQNLAADSDLTYLMFVQRW